ncbi:MAG: Helix-turn-helix domain [Paenibacillus sp.]|jgi:DNA-binding XRE family transcriptional regulator|nr:Helix-turn-helix domain [Paenibacillus sp.]
MEEQERVRATRRPKSSPSKKDRNQVPRPWLKRFRLDKDVSQAQMGADLKVSDVAIKHLESGERDPSFMMAFVYAQYFGRSVEECFPDVVEEATKYYKSLKENFSVVTM